MQHVFATESFGMIAERRNSFVLLSSGDGKGYGLWAAKELILFRLGVTRDSESLDMRFGKTLR